MKKQNVKWIRAILFGCALFTVSACNKSNEPMGKGQVEFQVTDAPTDDAAIQGVFVTVAEIRVNNQAISGFTKQTVDLKAYQEGTTKLLGSAEVDAKGYSNVTLVLDADTDASGNAPGCYVLTDNNTKFKLKNSGAIELGLDKDWSVQANSKTTLVIDFDLRKAVRSESDPAIRYSFVSNDNLKAAARVVIQGNAGTIHGMYSEQFSSNADKVIVYAYRKGSFTAGTESQAQGDDAIFFANAVASAEVKPSLSGNSFTLPFLEEGDYELHFAAYDKDSNSDRFVFHTLLASQVAANGSASEMVTVNRGININVTALITGTL